MENPSVWLIGENNPYSSNPRDALFPLPERSAGGRLCSVIPGMYRDVYLDTFVRVNLLSRPKWSAPAAREAACELLSRVPAGRIPDRDRVILLGRKVFDACFEGCEWEPFRPFGRFLALPHPSGLCRAWQEPGAYIRARAAVLDLAPWLAGKVGQND